MDAGFFAAAVSMCEEAAVQLGAFENGSLRSSPLPQLRAVGDLFLSGGHVRQEILDMVSPQQRYAVKQAVLHLANLNVLYQKGHNGTTHGALSMLCNFGRAHTDTVRSLSKKSVFYSWQAARPSATNRNLIRSAIELAVGQLNSELQLEMRVDSDTSGVPGSPDIVNTVLRKIDGALLLVADVTLLACGHPNSNVLFELGYAIRSLGDSNVVMVFNSAFGEPRNLPFDLGLKRQILYHCDESSSRSDARKSLAGHLRLAIGAVIQSQPSTGGPSA